MSNESLSRDQRLQLILAAYLQEVEADKKPDREKLLAQHPELADDLRSFLAENDKMRRLVNQADAATLAPTSGPHADEVSSAVAAADAPAVGTTIRYFGDYELLEEIARGGMGVVYKARQVSLNRVVALKMILAGELASPADVQRFHTEAQAAANLDHPNIVPIYEVGEHEGQHFFSMKLIEGGSLSDKAASGDWRASRVSGGSKDAQRRAAVLTAAVSRAVHHAHQRGILHRDLKPANILLASGGRKPPDTAGPSGGLRPPLAEYTPIVTDFGLAKHVEADSGQTKSGAIMGTPSYMAPEQARAEKDLTTAVDVYSLGAILYECITGQPPFRAATALDTILRVISDPPARPRSLNPTIDRDLETICLKCLEKEPGRRYESAAALADDLEHWLKGEPILARPVGWAGRLWRWTRRNRGAAAAMALIAVALVTSSVLTWRFSVARAAERQAQLRADGGRLCMLSEAVRGHKPDLALLLAIEGAERNPGELADNALWGALDLSYQKRTLQTSKQDVFAAMYSGDGREILTLCSDRIARRWDAASYGLLGEIKGPAVRGNVMSNQGVWKEFEAIGEFPVTAICTPAGLRVLTGAEIGFMVRDEKNEVVCEIHHKARGSCRNIGVARSPYGQFSPDGTKVVIVYGQLQPPEESVFSVQTGEKLFTMTGHRDNIQFAAFNPDGTRLVSCSRDKTARVWDTKTGRLVAMFTGNKWCGVGPVAFSPKGDRAITWDRQQQDGEVVARIWEVESGREISRLELQKNEMASVNQAFFSPDGTTVVTCGLGTHGGVANQESISDLCIWDAATGKRLHTLLRRGLEDVHNASRARIATLSRDGRVLAAGGEDGVIRLFDAAKGELLRELFGHTRELSDIQFHADGRTLLTAGEDGTARLWDIVGPEEEQYHGVWRGIGGFAVSPDGRRLLLSRRTAPKQEPQVMLVDRQEGRTYSLSGHRGYVQVLGFSGDGTKALTASSNAVFIWDAHTGKLVRELPHDGGGQQPMNVATLSADGKIALSQMRGSPAQLWDANTGQPLRSLQNPPGIHTGLFTADSSRLLTTDLRLVPPLMGGDGMRVTIWDVATGQRLHEFEDDPDNKRGEFGTVQGSTSFGILSPDGTRVLTCSTNDSARIWDAATGERGPRLTKHTSRVTWGAFSPDSRLAATASDDGTARLWEVATGKELRVFRGHDTVLDRGREKGLICVQFSPLGTRLLTAGSDGKARVVEVATGKLIRHFPLPPGRDRFAIFLDDDTILTLAGESARIWPVDALAEARRRKPRELTAAEREKYEVDGAQP